MLKVGLTGGIGCGKSTVSQIFGEYGIPIIDADDISRSLVEPGQPALEQICKAFGDETLNVDGSLNRAYLRTAIFDNTKKKQRLEAILHPLVYNQMHAKMMKLNAPYCILSIPLLLEMHRQGFVDRVLVVDCPVETQIDRVKHRDGLPESMIQTIIASQVSREYRLTHADDIIDNAGTGVKLAEQVKKLHNRYLSISASKGITGQ